MRKLSNSLKESRFVDLINKKFTGEIRKEDKIFGNLQKLEPVDIGTSVLWADKDLCVDDKYLFTFDEVTDMLKDSEWRLPTVSEVRDLQKYEKEYRNGEYIFTNNGKSLTFYPHGYIDVFSPRKGILCPDNVEGWTGDISKINNRICKYLISISLTCVSVDADIYNCANKNSLLSARLVKDK